MKYTVEQLDELHAAVGLGPEWMKSIRRAELIRQEIDRIRCSRYPWENHSCFRTRSRKWRAGSKSSKPKYYWSRKKRGYC